VLLDGTFVFMANEYVITIRTVLDPTAGGGLGGASPFANLERSAEQSARNVEAKFRGSGPRIFQTLETGRQQWVTDQVKAAEQAAKGMVGEYVKAGNSRIENEKRVARELEQLAKPVIGTSSGLNRAAGSSVLDPGFGVKQERAAVQALERDTVAARKTIASSAEQSAVVATAAATKHGAVEKAVVKDIEAATIGSTARQAGLWEQLFTKNTFLVRQMGRTVGGQYGSMAAMGAQVGLSASKISSEMARSNKFILDQGTVLSTTTGKAKDLEKAYTSFQSSIGKAVAGGTKGNLALRASFNELGIDAQKALRDPETAFIKFIDHLRATGSESTRTSQAIGILGASNAKLVPALEGATIGFIAEEEAATGMAGVLATLLNPAVLAVAAALLVTIGLLVGLTVAGVKGTEAWAQYGEQVWKIEKQTGLTAKTIGTLKVISAETGTSMEKLTMATARLEVNLSKGVSKPASEAGQAIKLLHLNTKAFAEAKFDDKLVMLSKAWSGVSDQSTKARSEAALAGRGYYQLGGAIDELGLHFDKAQKKADQFGIVMSENDVQAAHDFNVQMADLGMQVEGFLLGVGRQLGPTIISGLNDIAAALSGNQSAWDGWGDFVGSVLSRVINMLRIGAAYAADIAAGSWSMPRSTVTGAKVESEEDIAGAMYMARKFGIHVLTDAELNPVDNTKKFDTKAGGGGKHKAEQTELQKLQKELRKTTDEIKALHDAGSKEFDLKFKVEDATRFKRDLEDILKLRYDLGIDVRSSLVEYGATEEQHKQAIETAEAEMRSLHRLKSIHEDVLKAVNEQADADAKLAALRVTSVLPGVNAATIAETKYLDAKVALAKADKELLAETAVSARMFAEAQQDAAGRAKRAYLELRQDATKELSDLQKSIDKNTLISAALRGDPIALETAIKGELDLFGKSNVPSAMDQIAQRAASLDANVAAIAMSVTGGKTPPTASPQATGVAATGAETAGTEVGDVVKTTTNKFQTLTQLYEKLFGQRITEQRVANSTAADKEIIYNEAQLADQLIHFDQDVADARRRNSVTRALEDVDTARQIRLAEAELADIEAGNANGVRHLQLGADLARVRSRIDMKARIIAMEGDIAHAGEDSADRMRLAYLTAIHDIQEADAAARDSIIRDQVQIADQTVFHSDRARASILDHMAQMKGYTEIFADGYIKLIDAAGSGIDSVLGKVTAKLGIFGEVIRGILGDLLKLTLNKIFRSLLSAVLGPAAGAPAQGGSSQSSGVLGFLGFGGGSNAQGGAPFSSAGGIGGILSGTGLFGVPMMNGGPNTGNTSALPSWSGGKTILDQITGVGGKAGSPGGVLGTGAPAGASLGEMLAASGPMLGLTLGAGIGASFGRGQSTLATVMGAAGLGAVGLVAGTALPAILTGAFAGLTALGFATLGIGAALAIAAYIIGKQAQRRAEEKQRTQWAGEALPQVMALLTEAQGGHVTVADARTRFEAIHSAYMQNVGTLKDSKTRRIATQWWDNDVSSFYWPRIEAAAKAGEQATEFEKKFVPTYQTGGLIGSRLSGSMPGYYNRAGEVLMYGHPEETVLTPDHVARLGGSGAMAAAGVPGYGSTANAVAAASAAGGAATSAPAGVNMGLPPMVIVVFSESEARALAAKFPHAIIGEKFSENIAAPGSTTLSDLSARLARGN
jgi:hypothetical protein